MDNLQKLISGFERDVRYPMHTLRAEVGRSTASQQIQKMGTAAFAAIAEHLAAIPPGDRDSNLCEAWILLLCWMGQDLNIAREDMPNGITHQFTDDWIEWARSNAAN